MNDFPYTSPDMRPYREFLNQEWGDHPLPDALAAAVPLEIQKLIERGGPTDSDWELTRLWADTLSEKGDVLLYGGKKGQAAALFLDLACSIAVLAFHPGGITLFGTHYECTVPEKRENPNERI